MGNKEITGAFCGISPVQQDRKRVEHEIIYDLKYESINTLQKLIKLLLLKNE